MQRGSLFIVPALFGLLTAGPALAQGGDIHFVDRRAAPLAEPAAASVQAAPASETPPSAVAHEAAGGSASDASATAGASNGDRQQAAGAAAGPARGGGVGAARSVEQRLGRRLGRIALDGVSAREAFARWGRRTGINLVMNWQALQRAGVDPDRSVNLNLRNVPARQVLELLMRQAGGQARLVYHATPWYVEVLTRRQANRQPVLRVYDVREMTMHVPRFTDAPEFDLRSALQSSTGGGGGGGVSGGGGGSGEGLFGNEQDQQQNRDRPVTERQRGERIINIIAGTVTPDIWQRNGGQAGTIQYHRGLLLINAPRYVHRQIGIPVKR